MLYKRMEKAQWYHTKKATVDRVVREALFEVVIFEQKLKYIEKSMMCQKPSTMDWIVTP